MTGNTPLETEPLAAENRLVGGRSLQIIKSFLLLFLLSMLVVNKQKSTWPFVSWALYSGYSARFRPPEATVSTIELRIYTADGRLHVTNPEYLLAVPRDSLSYKIVEQAFAPQDSTDEEGVDPDVRDGSRRHLVRSVRNLLSTESEVETIEAWEMTHPIESTSIPPIKRDNPSADVMLGRFSVESLSSES